MKHYQKKIMSLSQLCYTVLLLSSSTSQNYKYPTTIPRMKWNPATQSQHTLRQAWKCCDSHLWKLTSHRSFPMPRSGLGQQKASPSSLAACCAHAITPFQIKEEMLTEKKVLFLGWEQQIGHFQIGPETRGWSTLSHSTLLLLGTREGKEKKSTLVD